MNFFFDNTLAPAFARAIQELNKQSGHKIIHLRSIFNGNTDDAKWLNYLGRQKENWIIITGDKGILKTLHEQEALIKSGCILFVFDHPFQKKDFWSQINKIISVWPQIKDLSKKYKSKAIFKIHYRGKKIEKIK